MLTDVSDQVVCKIMHESCAYFIHAEVGYP